MGSNDPAPSGTVLPDVNPADLSPLDVRTSVAWLDQMTVVVSSPWVDHARQADGTYWLAVDSAVVVLLGSLGPLATARLPPGAHFTVAYLPARLSPASLERVLGQARSRSSSGLLPRTCGGVRSFTNAGPAGGSFPPHDG